MQNVYAITDVGINRQLNQDFIYASDTSVGKLPNLYIVADGMGGHNAGEFASKCAVEVLLSEIKCDFGENPKEIIARGIEKANQVIYEISLAKEEMSGMGTTLVVATIIHNQLLVFNIGDSRLYVQKEHLEQITIDHSYVEEMIRMYGLDRELARTHRNKNRITRAVGVAEEVEFDYFEVNLESETYILLCTDGLSNMITDQGIEAILGTKQTIMQKAINLVETANYNGGTDNISVILMKP